MRRIDEIYDFVLPEMAAHGIEDTPENRIAFLEGMHDSWREESEISLEKTMYLLELSSEVTRLSLKLLFPQITG